MNELEAVPKVALVTDKGQTANEFRLVVLPLLICDLRAEGNTGTHDSELVEGAKVSLGRIFSDCSQIPAWHGLANVCMEWAPNLRVEIRDEREVVYFALILEKVGIVDDLGQVNGGAALPPPDQPCTKQIPFLVMAEFWMTRDVYSVCLAIQELVEFGDKLIQLSKDEERAILGIP